MDGAMARRAFHERRISRLQLPPKLQEEKQRQFRELCLLLKDAGAQADEKRRPWRVTASSPPPLRARSLLYACSLNLVFKNAAKSAG